MKSNDEMSFSEWQEALGFAISSNDSGNSVSEIMEFTGLSRSTIQRKLIKGVKDKILSVGFANKSDIVGRQQRVPVYSLNKKVKK